MSNINDTATVTLQVNGEQPKKELASLTRQYEQQLKVIDEIRTKMKDPDAFKAAKANVEKYSNELSSLKSRLADAEKTFKELKETAGTSPAELKKAREAVKSLKSDIQTTSVALRNAKNEFADFDPKTLEKAKKQAAELKKKIDDLKSSTEVVQDVLSNLDKVSLKQLQSTLQSLNKQFKNAEQGSEEYKILAEKIRVVKEQIASVREELKESQSFADRFFKFTSKIWATFEIGTKVVSAAVSKMREYVDAYADMDQEMASVRKFSGMNETQVGELNEQFKQMDTRTSREELNKLAQDVGRLGKQSVDDVMGFVRAADKINVALDDLGDGATLTLSKLTGVFGVEEQFGTEKSLLKVGSVINELSQNCAASAPYITNFTERMAGVGAQANMTIPQIMGYAAVLDSSSQAVESSATALSQVLVHLYQDPAKYAKVAGLDVKEFTELLKKDANGAIILFLETLNKAGGMDVLSPMFKDMGENGSKAIASLSVLADQIDFVKAQQEVANEAFREGTSIDAEFEVQNNTVAASLDKCKNAAHEYQVELGERLYPLMAHFLSSTAAVAQALLVVLRYLFDHKAAVLSLAVAITTYTIALKILKANITAAAIQQALLNAKTATAKALTASWTAVTRLAAVAMALLSGNVNKAKIAWNGFNAALKASIIGAIIGLLTLLITKIVETERASSEFTRAMNDAEKSATSFTEEAGKEISELDKLFGKLQGAKKGTKEYKDAKEAIISRYGVYLKGLINEKGEIENLALAYDRLTWAANKSAQARGIDAAKKAVTETFFKESDEKTEKIRQELLKRGMGEQQVTRIVTSIAQAMASGQDVPIEIRRELMAFEKENRSVWADMFEKDRESPLGMVHKLRDQQKQYLQRSAKLDKMDTRYFATTDSEELNKQAKALEEAIASPSPSNRVNISISMDGEESAQRIKSLFNEKSGSDKDSLSVSKGSNGSASVSGYISRDAAEKLLMEITYEQQQRGIPQTNPNDNPLGDGTGYTSQTLSDKERKKQEAEERRKAAKAKKEFKDALDNIKGNRAEAETQAMADRSAGLMKYSDYIEAMRAAEVKYFDDASKLYQKHNLEEDEDYKTLLKKKQEADDKYNQKQLVLSKEATERIAKVKEQEATAEYNSKSVKTFADELAYKEKLMDIHMKKLNDLQQLYTKGSKEWEDLDNQKKDLEHKDQQEKQQAIIQKVAEFQKKFDQKTIAEKYELEYAALEELYKRKEISEEQYQKWLKKLKKEEADAEIEEKRKLPGGKSATPKSNVESSTKKYEEEKLQLDEALASGQISQEDYDARLGRIKDSLFDNIIAPLKDAKSEWLALMANMVDSWKDLASALNDPDGDPFNALANGIQATSALMGAVFSQMTAFMQAELQIQTSAVEKRYDKEIAAAEGNTYRVAKLEKEKEAQIAKLKNDANRKMFAMQVIQAVAQTATNALNAYGSTVVIPVVGPTLAPIAAAVAAAQGAVQIALIKKQQQASETQGYSKGGFTKPGAVDEPAGIVHAGEWVASQRLLASPVARPMIEALDYAQRTNTIGSLRGEDVSRSITAPQTISRIADGNPSAAVMAASLESYAGVIDRLAQRLDEPFVTINRVAGDHGINNALDEYTKLMNNKSPKSRRKNANNY